MSKVWRKQTRELKAGALLLLLTIGAMGLCVANRGRMSQAQPRGIASQPAGDQIREITTLDNMENVDVPPHCVAPTREYGHGIYSYLSRYEVSRRERRRDFDVGFVRNQARERSVVWVKPECRDWLEAKAAESLRRYFMSGNAAAFPYHASTLRPYCGKTPEVLNCTMPLPQDRSVLIRSDQARVPAPLVRAKAAYDASRFQDLKLFAIEGSAPRESRSPVYAYQFGIEVGRRGHESLDFIRKGQVQYLALEAPARTHSFLRLSDLAESVPTLHVRVADRMQQSQLRRAVMRFVEQRSRALGEYWGKALRFSPGRTAVWRDPENGETAFSFMDTQGRYADYIAAIKQYSHESWYDDVLVSFTSGIMTNVSDQLMRASDATELMDTASYWWAVRSLQLALSCDEAPNGTFTYPPAGEQLIGLQWHYQSCRREYMQIAADNMSRWVEQSRGLALESITWQLMRVFGSRAERLNLYSEMLDRIRQQFQQGVVPSARGLSVLFFELDQLLHEKRERKLLLWNKIEDASPEDLEKIDSIIAKYRAFFVQVGPSVARREFTLADHYEQILGAWSYFGPILGLPSWNTLEEVRASSASGSMSLSRLIEALEQDFSGATPAGAVASALDRSRWTFENVSDAQKGEVCRAWLNFAERYRRAGDTHAFPMTTVDTDQMSTPHCLGLVPAWIRESNRNISSSWSALMSQCDRGHRLSCATLISMGVPEIRQWSLQRWEQVLRPSQPMDLLMWRYFVHAFALREDVQALMALQLPTRRSRSYVIPPQLQDLARLMAAVSGDLSRNLLIWVGREGSVNWQRFIEETATWVNRGLLVTEHTLPENPAYALGRYSVWNGELYQALEKIPEAMAFTCLSQAGSADVLREWGNQFVRAFSEVPRQLRPLRTGFGSIFQSPQHCDFPTRHSFGVRAYLSSCSSGLRVVSGRATTPEGQGELEDRYDPFSSR